MGRGPLRQAFVASRLLCPMDRATYQRRVIEAMVARRPQCKAVESAEHDALSPRSFANSE